jgi:hypothetical protein
MKFADVFRKFWPIFLIAAIFISQNLRQGAERRRRTAKARRTRLANLRASKKPKGRKRTKGSAGRGSFKPGRKGKLGPKAKAEFLARMARGRRKAAKSRGK